MVEANIQEFIATGRRKSAVARVRLAPGTGKIVVNGRTFENYFVQEDQRAVVIQPLPAPSARPNSTSESTSKAAAFAVKPMRSATASPARCKSPIRTCALR